MLNHVEAYIRRVIIYVLRQLHKTRLGRQEGSKKSSALFILFSSSNIHSFGPILDTHDPSKPDQTDQIDLVTQTTRVDAINVQHDKQNSPLVPLPCPLPVP